MHASSRTAALALLVLLAACGTPEGRGILQEVEAHPEAAATVQRWRPADDRPPELEEVARFMAQAAAGDEDSAEAALKLARSVHESDAEDPVRLAYLGSATAIQARFTGNPLAKLGAAKDGVAFLDQAVTAAPDDLEVRFLRASSTFPMPTFLGRSDQAIEDLAWLDRRALAGLDAGQLTPRMVALSQLYHGIARREAGDLEGARRAFTVAARYPQCRAGRKAREQLSALAAPPPEDAKLD